MPLWAWVAIVALMGLAVLVVLDQVSWNRRNVVLRDTAQSLDAWPIAATRDGCLIVLLHRESTSSDKPFLLIAGEARERIGAQDVYQLWNRARIQWYRVKHHGMLGMRHFHWYLDAHPDQAPPNPLERKAPTWLTILVLGLCAGFVLLTVLAMVFGW